MLSHNINLSLNTGSKFENFKIIIYENNSNDRTKSILNNYINNSHIKIISEDIEYDKIKKESKIWSYTEITGSDHPCRIEQICNARNKIINEINNEEYDEFDYIIWIDLDSNGWSIDGIIDSFNRKDTWDAVFANGLNNNNMYYDLYALRTSFFSFGPEIIGEFFWTNLKSFSLSNYTELIPVYSAFGGIGIYKKNIFKNNKYDCLVNEDVKIFYRNLLNLNSYNTNILNIINNQDYKFTYGYKDEKTNIFWKSNSGYDKPVICEHISLNLKLFNEGYKLFINPLMVYNCYDK